MQLTIYAVLLDIHAFGGNVARQQSAHGGEGATIDNQPFAGAARPHPPTGPRETTRGCPWEPVQQRTVGEGALAGFGINDRQARHRNLLGAGQGAVSVSQIVRLPHRTSSISPQTGRSSEGTRLGCPQSRRYPTSPSQLPGSPWTWPVGNGVRG